MPQPFAAVLFSSLILLAAATDAAASDAQRIAELEARVAHLEARLAQIERRLGEAPQTSSRKDDATPPSPLPSALAIPPPAATPPATLPPVQASRSEPESKQAGAKSYTAVLDILRALPADTRPHPKTGWDPLALSNANLWLKNHLVGSIFDGRFTVAPSASARLARERNGRMIHEIHFTLNFETPPVSFLGVTVHARPSAGRIVVDSELYDGYERAAQSPAQRVAGPSPAPSCIASTTSTSSTWASAT